MEKHIQDMDITSEIIVLYTEKKWSDKKIKCINMYSSEPIRMLHRSFDSLTCLKWFLLPASLAVPRQMYFNRNEIAFGLMMGSSKA